MIWGIAYGVSSKLVIEVPNLFVFSALGCVGAGPTVSGVLNMGRALNLCSFISFHCVMSSIFVSTT